MAGKQAGVPQWTETKAEQRREEGDVSAAAAGGGGADAERLRALLLRRERKVISSSLSPSAGKNRKGNGLGKKKPKTFPAF